MRIHLILNADGQAVAYHTDSAIARQIAPAGYGFLWGQTTVDPAMFASRLEQIAYKALCRFGPEEVLEAGDPRLEDLIR